MALRQLTLMLLLVALPCAAAAQSNRPADAAVYFPDAVWQHKTPAESGLDPARLKEATDFAVANEVKSPRDPGHDLVAVVRWIDGGAMDGFVKRLLASANTM